MAERKSVCMDLYNRMIGKTMPCCPVGNWCSTRSPPSVYIGSQTYNKSVQKARHPAGLNKPFSTHLR